MALLIDGQYRVGNLPKAPKPAPKPASTPVDASDRKLYVKAAETSGDKQVLKDFDAALAAQSKPAPPKPAPASAAAPQKPAVTQKPHVQAERAEDPSDQKFYNMAADRQNKVIDLENRAAGLQHSIDALGTAGGYATQAMQAELDEVEEELQRYRPAPDAAAMSGSDRHLYIQASQGADDPSILTSFDRRYAAQASQGELQSEPRVERYQRVTVDSSYSGKLLGGAEGTLGVDYLVEYLDNGEVLVTRAGADSLGVEAGGKVGLRLDLGANEYGHFSGAEAKIAFIEAGGQTVRLESADDLPTFIAADVASLAPGVDEGRRGAGAIYEFGDRVTPGFLDRPAGFGLGLIDSVTPGDLRGARDDAVGFITYDRPAPETVYSEAGLSVEGTVILRRPQSDSPLAIFDPALGAGVDASVSDVIGRSEDTRSGEVTHYFRGSAEGAAYFDRDIADRLVAESQPPIVGEKVAERVSVSGRLGELGVPESGQISGSTSATFAYTVDAEGKPVSLEVTSEYQLNDGDQVVRTRRFALDENAGEAAANLIRAGTTDPAALPQALEDLDGSVTDLGVTEDRYRVESEDYGLEGGIVVADAGLSVTVQSATRVEG
ncbi:MAG: hypothetical protein R3F54_18145 [Alphaproteobacteria bacterium]